MLSPLIEVSKYIFPPLSIKSSIDAIGKPTEKEDKPVPLKEMFRFTSGIDTPSPTSKIKFA